MRGDSLKGLKHTEDDANGELFLVRVLFGGGCVRGDLLLGCEA